MNKKLESAMEFATDRHVIMCLNNEASDKLDDSFKAGFQKGHEIMAEREAQLVSGANSIVMGHGSDLENLSEVFVDTLRIKRLRNILKDLEIEKGEK